MNKIPKIMAFYLPQYHEIEENNKWWGKGFTEWVNTKKAKPLFEDHYQPRVPYLNNYYDLTNIESIKWQSELMKKYNVHGVCMYHYWFNGKKLLEKPMELLLENPEIDMNYCICWANETWCRTWDGKEKDILIKQDYGNEKDWLKHLEYMIPFFNDPRYIKDDGHPLLVIYKTQLIPNINEMISFWQENLIERGLKTIKLIEVFNGKQDKCYCDESQGYIEFEPNYTWSREYEEQGKLRYILSKLRIHSKKIVNFSNNVPKIFLDIKNYDEIWGSILKRNRIDNGRDVYLGAFVNWDNTARKKYNSTITVGSTPEKFEKYLFKQCENAINNTKSKYVFINAWNEWAEGTYLEPDEKYRHQYLEAVRNVVNKLNQNY